MVASIFQMKFTLFEGGVRGAACVYSPAIKNPSRISNQLIHVTDWLPTFYSAAGGNLEDLEENLDGVDQWATIVSEENTKRKNILLNIDEKEDLSGALMGRYKLINGNYPFLILIIHFLLLLARSDSSCRSLRTFRLTLYNSKLSLVATDKYRQ